MTSKLIIIMLNGGMDGLSAVPFVGSDDLEKYRPNVHVRETLPLKKGFAMHAKLPFLHDLFHAGELSILHACGLPVRTRSHFKAQDYIQSGELISHPRSGWLGRLMRELNPKLEAVAYDNALPVLLQGSPQAFTWTNPVISREDQKFIEQLDPDFYREDRKLLNAYKRLLSVKAISDGKNRRPRRVRREIKPFRTITQLLSHPNGPDIGVYQTSHWDTHDNQLKRLDIAFSDLNSGLELMKLELGEVWKKTTVIVFSEFGRMIPENGTAGTDHGTGGAAFVMGGNIKGGQILGDWPGLKENQLYEGRDLMPANDIRELFTDVLHRQFGWSESDIKRIAFPDMVKRRRGLFA